MNKTQIRNHVRTIFSYAFRPFIQLFNWWTKFSLPNGTTFFVLPDSTAIFMIVLTPIYLFALLPSPIYFVALFIAPLFLSLVMINKGRVLIIKMFICIPYWFTRIPKDSEFEIYESFGATVAEGVAFTLTTKQDYLHLGTVKTAYALEKALGETLKNQGWYCNNIGILTNANESN